MEEKKLMLAFSAARLWHCHLVSEWGALRVLKCRTQGAVPHGERFTCSAKGVGKPVYVYFVHTELETGSRILEPRGGVSNSNVSILVYTADEGAEVVDN